MSAQGHASPAGPAYGARTMTHMSTQGHLQIEVTGGCQHVSTCFPADPWAWHQ